MAVFKSRAKKKLLVKKQNGIVSVKAAPKPKKKKKGILKKVVQKAAGVTILLPLQPFKPAMKKNLEGKGVSTKGMTFSAILEKFFNENISKKANKASHFEEIESGYISNNYLMRTPESQLNESDNLAADALVIIVKETVKFFKNKKDKKAAAASSGENPKNVMTKEELDVAGAAEQVTKALEKKAAGEEPATKKNIMIYAGIAAALGLVVWFISKKS